jgi:hypothetical protein
MRRELQTAAMDGSIKIRQGVVVAAGCDVLFQQPPNHFNGIEPVSAVDRQVSVYRVTADCPPKSSSTRPRRRIIADNNTPKLTPCLDQL